MYYVIVIEEKKDKLMEKLKFVVNWRDNTYFQLCR